MHWDHKYYSLGMLKLEAAVRGFTNINMALALTPISSLIDIMCRQLKKYQRRLLQHSQHMSSMAVAGCELLCSPDSHPNTLSLVHVKN
jgi:hypothetical protein